MTLLRGHFSFSFSRGGQWRHVLSATRVILKNYSWTIARKSKSATLHALENFSGDKVAGFCCCVRAVTELGWFTPYLPTIPVWPRWPLTLAGLLCNWQKLLLLKQGNCGCIQFTNIHVDTQLFRHTGLPCWHAYTKSLHRTWHLCFMCSAAALTTLSVRRGKELLKAHAAWRFIRPFDQTPFMSSVFMSPILRWQLAGVAVSCPGGSWCKSKCV